MIFLKKRLLLLFFLLSDLLFLFFWKYSVCNAFVSTIHIPYGNYTVHINGKRTPDGKSIQFLGLKYATADRFKHSKLFYSFSEKLPHEILKDVHIQAKHNAPACAQVCPPEWIDCIGSEIQSEDCLNLDISIPYPFFVSQSLKQLRNNLNNDINKDEEMNNKKLNYNKNKYRNISINPLPIFVFFHGGAFRFGNINSVFSGDIWSYRSNAIVITVSYRLGMFGFLKYGNMFEGNQGFVDQINALKWIQEYIHYFGGDKNKITLVGHSAGAICVACHLSSPYSQGLFHKAILMSASLGDPRKTIQQSELIAKYALNESNIINICGSPLKSVDMDPSSSLGNVFAISSYEMCLTKKANTKDILRASEYAEKMAVEIDVFYALHSWDITIDKKIIPMDCTIALLQGKMHDGLDLIMGSVNGEGIFLRTLPSSNFLFNPLIYSSMMLYYFSNHAPYLFRVYPSVSTELCLKKLLKNSMNVIFLRSEPFTSINSAKSIQKAFGNYVYNCAIRRVARALRHFNKKVYLYIENYGYEWTKSIQKHEPCHHKDYLCKITSTWCSSNDIVCHGEDMPILFQKVPFPGYQFSKDEVEVSQIMYDYFTSFALDGIPSSNNTNFKKWNLYNPKEENYQFWKKNSSNVLYGLYKSECDVWDMVIPNYNLTWQQHRNKNKMAS